MDGRSGWEEGWEKGMKGSRRRGVRSWEMGKQEKGGSDRGGGGSGDEWRATNSGKSQLYT